MTEHELRSGVSDIEMDGVRSKARGPLEEEDGAANEFRARSNVAIRASTAR